MKKNHIKQHIGVLVSGYILCNVTYADVIQYTNEAQWEAAANNISEYNFNDNTVGALAVGSTDFGDFSINTKINGINTENSNQIRNGDYFLSIDGTPFVSLDVDNSDATSFISIQFDEKINAFSADWTSTSNAARLTATIAGETTNFVDFLPTGNGFLGFTSDIAFDTISFGIDHFLFRDSEFFGIDNVRYSAISVTEPSTWLFGFGLVGVGLLRRRLANQPVLSDTPTS